MKTLLFVLLACTLTFAQDAQVFVLTPDEQKEAKRIFELRAQLAKDDDALRQQIAKRYDFPALIDFTPGFKFAVPKNVPNGTLTFQSSPLINQVPLMHCNGSYRW